MSDYESSLLTAISAAMMLCKMLDYQKNTHAEVINKELGSVEPAFLAIFGLDELLDVEACCSAILSILKAYLDRKVIQMNAEVTVSILIKNPMKKKFVLDYYYQN
jgi:hypothetical protein